MKQIMFTRLTLRPPLLLCFLIVGFITTGFAQQTPSQELNTEQEDSLHRIAWRHQTDSLIKINRIDFTNFTRLGGLFNGKEGCVSFNTFLMLSKYRTYDFGIGTGFEYYNRGTVIHLIQIPFYLSNRIYVSRKIYFLFEPGVMVPVGGHYNSDIENPAVIKTKIKYEDTELKPAFYYNLGMGLYSESKFCLELFMRNQSNGVLYPVHERITMVGLNMGVKL